MRIPILRKLDATIEIDPILETMDNELYSLGATVAALDDDKKPEAQALLNQARADRDSYHASAEEKPLVRIRMLPPDVLASLRSGIVRAPISIDSETRESLAGAIERTRKLNRAICRWGVVGWCIKITGESIQCSLVDDETSGRKYEVASDESVDLLEANGLLDAVAVSIWRFSSLQEDDRKK